ncbi:GH32 C-terminal domain-containing protein [Paenibacillus cellulositrophicus]|uniref:GH32 C-terminal domain-containing protein n=1 Tax=Paenibacillus cellulositrophicus TaxID=562959 RepID=UPI003D98094F
MRSAKKMLSACLAGILACASILLYGSDEGRGWAMPADSEVKVNGAAAALTKEADRMAASVNTNLEGWQVQGKGELEQTAEGLKLASDPQENVMAVSSTKADDFIYEADVMIQNAGTDASLLFRASSDGWSSYMLQIVPSSGIIRLKNAAGGGLQEERQVPLKVGEIYHLKVKVEGTSLQVYWGSQYQPVIRAVDTAYASGYLGLHVWNGSAVFQNVKVGSLAGNLDGMLASTGSWQPDLKGLKGTGTTGQAALRVYRNIAADAVYEGNVTLGEASSAGMLIRTNAEGTAGYEAVLRHQGSGVQVLLRKMDGSLISASTSVYPDSPNAKHHLEIQAVGPRIQVFVDGYAPAAVDVTDDSYSVGYTGLVVREGTAYVQDAYVTLDSEYYTETYRPEYHYSPIRGSASDPNGLVYFEGEYHLFHQDGGQWAHAVSRDLLHWKQLPIALPWNDLGHVWSGSAVADTTNASGLFGSSGGKGLIAYYTSYSPDLPNGNQKIGLAYSTDQGRTWQYSAEHPVVIDNPGKNGADPGGWDFRDPKVVRDEANGRWVMVVSGGDHIRFFTSRNLIDWTLTDNFGYGEYVRGGVWECPDLFQLPVDGTDRRKWVLMISTGANPKTQGSDAEYFIGELTPEGKFMNDNPAGTVLKTDWGKEFYASMSFSGTPDGRRILLAWMTNWDYPFSFPTEGWKGQMTVPREVTLHTTGNGIRLFQSPVRELAGLRSTLFSVKNREVSESAANVLGGISAGAYEIEADIELPQSGAAAEFGFTVREGGGQKTMIGYKTAEQKLFVDRSSSGVTDYSSLLQTRHEAALQPDGSRIRLRILVDESSVEVFGNNGRVVFSDLIFPDPARRGMSFYTKGGKVKLASLQVHALDNVWREGRKTGSSIILDRKELELSKGDEEKLYASYLESSGASHPPLVWKSSNPGVVQVTSSNQGESPGIAVLRANKAGTAVITAVSPNGKASARCVVNVTDGTFTTNLTGWKPDLSASRWVVTERGIRGSYTSDANYMAQEEAGDFALEADMTLGETGGAGSILFRASADGRSGYYFNLDPNLKAIRLFYKVDGRFEDRQVLAKAPRFIQPGRTYHIRIEAKGPQIRAEVDGVQVFDVKDGTFAEGHFGVNVFGGQAFYQQVTVSGMADAKLAETTLVNAASGLALFAAESQNGEPVTVGGPEGASPQVWVFVPNGDGTWSIRTQAGKALDLDTGQGRLQLYDYLGYNNQRWRVEYQEDAVVKIYSVHNGQALEVSADGTKLQLGDPAAGEPRQRWKVLPDADLYPEK